MGEQVRPDSGPTRHQGLDVILRLHGPQDVAVAAHHRDTPQATVGVRIGRALIYFHDWAGAAGLARSLQQFSRDGMQLPAVTVPTSVPGRPDLVRAATVIDVEGALPVIGALRRVAGEHNRLDITFGRLGLLIYDRGAYSSVRAAFRQAEQLCSTALPLPARPTLRAVARDRAATALTPPSRGGARAAAPADRAQPRRPRTVGRWLE